jgi:hypothetical protein
LNPDTDGDGVTDGQEKSRCNDSNCSLLIAVKQKHQYNLEAADWSGDGVSNAKKLQVRLTIECRCSGDG